MVGPRISPIGNEWNPPAARFGRIPIPPAPPAPPPPPPPPPDACTCNLTTATLTEAGTAYATETYARRSARLSGDATVMVVPVKTSSFAFSGAAAVYLRAMSDWTLVSTITGIGSNEGGDDIIAALSGDTQRLLVLNQAGDWPFGGTGTYGFERQPGNNYAATNDGFPITGDIVPTGTIEPPGPRQYAAAVLDSTGDSVYLIGVNGSTGAWVMDRFDWQATGEWLSGGWAFAETFTPWGAQASTPFAFFSVISGDDTHIAVRRQSDTADGISVLTNDGSGWTEAFVYDGITPGGYTVPLSLGPDGSCMLVAEAETSAGPFTIWLTERTESGIYLRSALLSGSFTNAPMHASDDYGLILFADEATPDVETFETTIDCAAPAPATPSLALTAPSPASGYTDEASGNFTVTAADITLAIVVTPADTLAGSFTPTSVTVQPGDLTKTFTLTPTVTGTHSVSITNDGGVTNPSPVAYTVTDAPAEYDVSARVAAFIARHKAVRVSLGASNTSTFEGTLDLPTAPTITSSATVSNASELAANMVDGRHITFSGSGFTGDISLFGRSDMRFTFPSGFLLTGNLDYRGASRIEFLGIGRGTQHVSGAHFAGYSATTTDILVKNMDIRTPSGAGGSGPTRASRVAYVDCYLLADPNNYLFFWVRGTSFIIANCYMATQSPANFALVRGGGEPGSGDNGGSVLIMDSCLANEFSGQYALRPNGECVRMATWNNQFNDGRMGCIINTEVNCYDWVVIDNASYGGGINLDSVAACPMFTLDSNDFYLAPGTGQVSYGTSDPAYLVGASSNPLLPPTTPPPWSRQ